MNKMIDGLMPKKIYLTKGKYIFLGIFSLLLNYFYLWSGLSTYIREILGWNNMKSEVVTTGITFIVYPILITIWRFGLKAVNTGRLAIFWFFLGYFISVLPYFFLLTVFFISRSNDAF